MDQDFDLAQQYVNKARLSATDLTERRYWSFNKTADDIQKVLGVSRTEALDASVYINEWHKCITKVKEFVG